MKKSILIILIFISGIYLQAWITETASLEEFIYGHSDSLEYDNWLSHVVEGIADPGYNLYAPYDLQTNGFGRFTVPDNSHLYYWEQIGEALAAGNYPEVDTLLYDSEMPFKLVEFNDTVSGQTYWVIRENLNPAYIDDNGTPGWSDDDERGSFDCGWGVFIINPDAEYPVIITAPHICDDFHTAPYGVKAFRETGAYALLMNGTCREVEWNNPSNPNVYTNSSSLCDPSRVENLPFNRVYQAFCDHLRDTFGQREFSLQIHSYDWNRHQWYSNCQISAGYNKDNPGLPIRDYSDFGLDIANIGNPVIHSANSLGIHPDVHVNDFFAFHCSTYPFYYSNEDTTFAINTSIDLPGYSQNRQMIYSCNGWSDDLTRDPFFHIEMDELPNCYPQTEANYYWFWGYDPILQRFDYDRLYDIAFEFYNPWIEQLAEVIPQMLDNEDGQQPTDISPLQIVSSNSDQVFLEWEKTNCYDYTSYQILYSDEPISNGNYDIWDMDNDSQLGNSARTYTTVRGLNENTEYFFQARVLDANGNYSEPTEEISCLLSPAGLENEKAVGRDGYVDFSFHAYFQSQNAGFYIYRKAENETEYSLMDSYESNPSLIALNGVDDYTYNWSDSTVTNWIEYDYIAASSDLSGNEYWHNYHSYVTPFDIYTLHFESADSLFTDEIWFGASPQASDNWDSDYDIGQNETPSSDYVFAEFYEGSWNAHRNMIRQIEGGYDFDSSLKSWVFRVRSDQYDDEITLSALGNLSRDGRKLYITDQSSGLTIDLLNNDYSYLNNNGNWRYFNMFWGNLVPDLEFAEIDNHIFQAGENFSISWNVVNNFVLESIDVYVQTPTDLILISENLPPFFNQTNWVVPENLLLENARIIVDLLMIDGDRHQYTSPYKFGTIPSTYTYAVPAGEHLVANPFTGISEINQLLGDDAEIYTYQNGTYLLENSYDYGTGYFLESVFGHVALVNSDIQSSYDQFDLETGWNIIPNPHLIGYKPDDLRIISPDWEITYAEAVQLDLIENVIYTIDNTWHQTSYIRPGEAFLIYVNEPGLQIKFIPFVESHNQLILEKHQLSVRLTAFQYGYDRDELILSLNDLGSDGFDQYYDLPEPPCKTGNDNLSFFTIADSTAPFSQLNENTIADYDLLNEERIWDFSLIMQQQEDILFAMDPNEIPPEVFVIMTIDGTEHDLSRDGDFIYHPENLTVQGTISFTPSWMADNNEIILPVCSLQTYPNPFIATGTRSETVKIVFHIPEKSQAELTVYNIKGQKVAQLANREFDAGKNLINWDLTNNNGKRISSGIYFTRLSGNDFEKFTKMIIIR